MSQIIILPGIGGSGESHWQTIWEKFDSSMVRFRPPNWDAPDLNDWLAALDEAVDKSGDSPILVAHSLACLLIVHWAARRRDFKVRGAFLVAVPDPDGPSFPAAEAASFRPVPELALPFPTLVVASTNDPYGSVDYVRTRATAWGAGLVIAGALGHMNADSALGEWELGAMLFRAFRAGIRSP